MSWLEINDLRGKCGVAHKGLRGSFKARDTATQQIGTELGKAPGCILKTSTQTV